MVRTFVTITFYPIKAGMHVYEPLDNAIAKQRLRYVGSWLCSGILPKTPSAKWHHHPEALRALAAHRRLKCTGTCQQALHEYQQSSQCMVGVMRHQLSFAHLGLGCRPPRHQQSFALE